MSCRVNVSQCSDSATEGFGSKTLRKWFQRLDLRIVSTRHPQFGATPRLPRSRDIALAFPSGFDYNLSKITHQ
jgi:hypothetical protein